MELVVRPYSVYEALPISPPNLSEEASFARQLATLNLTNLRLAPLLLATSLL